MARVVVTLATQVKQFPAGTVVGDFHVEIEPVGGGEKLFLDQAEASFTFDDVKPGEYVARAWRNGDGGAQLSTPVEQTFTVAAPPMDVQVPVSVTITMP